MDEERIKRLLKILAVSIIVILLLKTLLLRTAHQVKSVKDKKAVAEKSQGVPAATQSQPVPVTAESQPVPVAPTPVPASGVN